MGALIWPVVAIAYVAFAVLAFVRRRWAYPLFVATGLSYFPIRAGWPWHGPGCSLDLSAGLVAFSLTNYAHIVLFALFFIITARQFERASLRWAGLITVVVGAVVEVEQGLTGVHNCKLRDVIPDAAGALLGAIIVAALSLNSARARSDSTPRQ